MHLFLIGYRGSGKSTVGRLLARQLELPFVDTDQQIESVAERTIKEIFEGEGEGGFRDREQAAIAQVASQADSHVVSLGGGAIIREENRNNITRSGRCIWLQASAEQLYARIHGDSQTATRRPTLAGGGYDEVVKLLAQREPIYHDLAAITVQTGGRSAEDIVAEIAAWVTETDK